MRYLRQATTVTVQVGPFLDSADGVTAKTALTVTVQISKAGGTFGGRNSATAITHDADGFYKVELDATDTGTGGPLMLKSFVATACPVWHEFTIMAAARYDLAILGSGVQPVNLTQIDGLATNANLATLNLKQLNIVNNAGSAIVASATGSNGVGIAASGNGTGAGLAATGGATAPGLLATGGATSGAGLQGQAGGGGAGIVGSGIGTSPGIYGQGGVSGHGIQGQGGSTTGNGLFANSLTTHAIATLAGGNGHGLSLSGNGTGAGLKATGGATGHGAQFDGGATGGDGLRASGTGSNSSGITAAGKYGINASGVGGPAITGYGTTYGLELGGDLRGVSVYGDQGGMLVAGLSGNAPGLEVKGFGTGAGLKATAGATGAGATFDGGATAGEGIIARGNGAYGSGLAALGAGAAPGLYATSFNGPGALMFSNSTAAGLECQSDAGPGLWARAVGIAGNGMLLQGRAADAGLKAVGGATGHGLAAFGGSSSGAGIHGKGGPFGRGMYLLGGAPTGTGLTVEGGASGDGAEFLGGGTAGSGIYCGAQNVGHGMYVRAFGASYHGLFSQADDGDCFHALATGTGKAFGDTIVDSILTRASIVEPTAVPSYPASLASALGFHLAVQRNKMTQTNTTSTLRNAADTLTIATATHTVAGGVHTRGAFS